MTEWLCPNITSFTLLNHPETYTNGRDFRLVVDYCDENEDTCITDEAKRRVFFETIRLNSKVIYQFFDTEVYNDSKKFAYTRNSEMSSGFILGTCL